MALRSKAASKTEYNSRPFTKSNLAGRSFCLGVMPIPCPHFKITIVKRSQGQSAVAGAAYQSGERLFSEYDQKTKFYNKKKELVHAEIMLPSHAPPGYADRATLWNAVEAVENQWNSQLARRIVLAFPVEVHRPGEVRHQPGGAEKRAERRGAGGPRRPQAPRCRPAGLSGLRRRQGGKAAGQPQAAENPHCPQRQAGHRGLVPRGVAGLGISKRAGAQAAPARLLIGRGPPPRPAGASAPPPPSRGGESALHPPGRTPSPETGDSPPPER